MSSSNTSFPTRKDIIISLMAFVGKEKKTTINRTTGKGTSKEYLTYQCPKPGCASPTVSFLDKTGFKNPYKHLRSCYAKGKDIKVQEQTLFHLYEEAKQAMTKKGGTIRSHFEIKTLSEYERAMRGYIRLIVAKSLPLCYVADPDVRKFSRYDVKIGKKKLVEVLFKLVEMLEKRIAVGLKVTKGAVLFDGWSCNYPHYVAAIASYCTSVQTRDNSASGGDTIPRLTLLALSPMGHVAGEDDENNSTDETATFNAEAHVQFSNEIFPFFGQQFSKWCVCLIGDNCNTNLKVASLANKHYVGCNSHKLNLEVNHMVDRHVHLKATIDSVHETMKEARKLKNAALLRNLTDLKPVMHNTTRWSGKLHMLKRFMQIRDELIEVRNAPEGDLVIDTSARLTSRVQKFQKMLAEIDVVTKSLQTRGHTLADCRDDLDVLVETVVKERDLTNSPLYQCKLDMKYISPEARMVLHPAFETGVVKIQRGLHLDLSEDEKEAVQCLQKGTNAAVDNEHSQSATSSAPSMAQRLTKRRKKEETENGYINCDFILGSVAKVERLWSIAKYVLTENRWSMTPQLFEAIVFLKVNERFWDAQLVSEPINGTRSDRAAARIEAHDAHQGLNSNASA